MQLKYRTLPNDKVVKCLPEAAQVLLATLYWYRNHDTGQLNPRHQTVGRELGWSYWKVQTYIRVLREAGTIRAIKTQRGNEYEIQPQEEWRKPERKAWARPCRSKHLGESTYVKTPRQSSRILNEPALSLLNHPSPPPNYETGGGGGGSPAALPVKRKPAPRTPAPEPEGSSPSEPPPPDCKEKAKALVLELLPQHQPEAGSPTMAIREVARVLAEGGTTEAIRESHQKYRKLWATFAPGRFVPHFWRWIQEGDWLNPPNEHKIGAAPKSSEEVKADRDARKRSHLEAMREFHFLPPQIERDMTRAGFSAQEIDDELVYEGWRRRAS